MKKLPGDTHIKNMHPDLKKYVIQNLSMYKGNGKTMGIRLVDWRAARVILSVCSMEISGRSPLSSFQIAGRQ